MSLPDFNPDLAAWTVSLEFLTGYIVEKSLSVDNIFIFVMVFAYFAIPTKYQHRVLFFGIIGALVFRAIFNCDGFGTDAVSPVNLSVRRIFNYHGA